LRPLAMIVAYHGRRMQPDPTNLSPAEVLLSKWMGLSFVLYAGTTVVFCLARSQLFDLLSRAGALFGLPETPASSELFWFSLTISMMVMLCVCCAYVVKDPRRNRDFCVPVIFGKASGSLAGILAFLLFRPYPVHITIAVTDLPLGLVTYFLWRRAATKPKASARGG